MVESNEGAGDCGEVDSFAKPFCPGRRNGNVTSEDSFIASLSTAHHRTPSFYPSMTLHDNGLS